MCLTEHNNRLFKSSYLHIIEPMAEKYQDKRQTTAQMLVDSLNLNPVCYWCQVEWNNFWVYGNIIPPIDDEVRLARLHRKGDKKRNEEQKSQN